MYGAGTLARLYLFVAALPSCHRAVFMGAGRPEHVLMGGVCQ